MKPYILRFAESCGRCNDIVVWRVIDSNGKIDREFKTRKEAIQWLNAFYTI